MRRVHWYSNAITHSEDQYAMYLSWNSIPFKRQEVICLTCGFHTPAVRDRCPGCRRSRRDVAVVDFLIEPLKLVIEIDGSVHYRVRRESKDTERAKALNKLGYSLIRITNKMVDKLWRALLKQPHS